MESLNSNRATNKWRKRFQQNPSSKSNSANIDQNLNPSPLLALIFFLVFSFFVLLFTSSSKPLILQSTNSQQKSLFLPHQCASSSEDSGEKFLWYAPHSGFSNQLSEFKNAILMAVILRRTLIVPPILDHHAVALGSCPKFRVLSPNDLRFSVWNHSIHLLRDRRYMPITDIIDISSLVSDSMVKVADFRAFASNWCGLRIADVCSDNNNYKLFEDLTKCGLFLSGHNGNVGKCVYGVDDDCRTTVWTYQRDGEDDVLDSFQPDEQLKKKKKISFVRKRRDVYKALGPGSEAELLTVLSFGSLFTAPYKGSESHIDIHEARKDQRIQSLIEKIEYMPYVPEILKAGKEFARQKIKAPFLCAQLRLLDGQFKNHWGTTFSGLKEKLESLKQNVPAPIHVFVMTDLPLRNWTGTYLGDLVNDPDVFKLTVLTENDSIIVETAKRLMNAGHNFGSVSSASDIGKLCHPQSLPDLLLFVEQTVCSCASLGFVGTDGSTIAESIELMRKHITCAA